MSAIARDQKAHIEEHLHVHTHEDGIAHNHYHHHPTGDHTHSHRPQRKTILAANELAYIYPNRSTPVFEGVSVEAKAGSVLAILGNNGAGKSTLLNICAGIARPTQGTVSLGKLNISQMSRRGVACQIAYVTQEHRVPHLTVYDQVLLGRKPHLSWSVSAYDRLVVSNIIEQLGLTEFANRYADELSGGERQKVHIARALAQEPTVLLLDEPTSALDPKNQMEVFEAVRAITDTSALATIVVLHDINLALRFCDSFLMLHNGQTIAYGGSEVLTDEALTKTYDYPLRIESIDGVLLAVPATSLLHQPTLSSCVLTGSK